MRKVTRSCARQFVLLLVVCGCLSALAWGMYLISRPDADEYFDQAVDAYRQGDYNLALRNASLAIERDGSNHYAVFLRGIIYHEQGDLERAIADYTYIIERTKGCRWCAYYNRAIAYYAQGDIDQAIADCRLSVQLMHPPQPEPLLALADFYYEVYDAERALRYYQRYIDLVGDDFERYVPGRMYALDQYLNISPQSA